MSFAPRQPLPRVSSPAGDGWSFEDYAQHGLDIARNAVPYIPVVGPASEMSDDLRSGNYKGALFNGAMLAADLLPFGPARRVIKIIDGINAMRRGPFLASAKTQVARVRKIEQVGKNQEIHHTIPIAGGKFIPRADRKTVELYRNHPANLKIMDKAMHRRMTGKYTDPDTGQVFEQFKAAQRAWHGTNALQKTTGAAAAATIADWGENLSRSSQKRSEKRMR